MYSKQSAQKELVLTKHLSHALLSGLLSLPHLLCSGYKYHSIL